MVRVAVLAGTTAVACGPPPTIEALEGDDVSADNLPDCPMGELDKATGVTNIVVWHALGAEPAKALEEVTQAFNDSQDEVNVTLQNQGADYSEVFRKYNAAAASGDTFYTAKLHTARFYFAKLLPETASLIRTARSGLTPLMAMDEAMF